MASNRRPERRETGWAVAFETRATDPDLADDSRTDGETIRNVAWLSATPGDCANADLVDEYLDG